MTRKEAVHLLRVCKMLRRRKLEAFATPSGLGDYSTAAVGKNCRRFLQDRAEGVRKPSHRYVQEWERELILEYAEKHCPDYALYKLVQDAGEQP